MRPSSKAAGAALLAGTALVLCLVPTGAADQAAQSQPEPACSVTVPAAELTAAPQDRAWEQMSKAAYFSPCLEDRYRAYAQDHPDLELHQVVLAVNIGLDRPFYEGVEVVDDPDSTAVLVNKYRALPQDYAPEVEPLGAPYGTGSLRPQAAQAFREMADAARADGIALRSVSAYRSYRAQARTHQRYVRANGQESTDTFSARPGHSEHQTGLALDINVASSKADFQHTAAYAWLVEHCWEHGFILRYPEGGQAITGYRFEPWHYRYVGVETAKACMERGLTYEEYLASQPWQVEQLPILPAN